MARIAWNKGITRHRPRPCLCGCGELVPLHRYPKKEGGFSYSVNDFLRGHGKRGLSGFNEKIHKPRICACGCGSITKKSRGRFNKFIKGHENRGRIAWNAGKNFSEKSRHRMRIARLGMEPVNKINVDKNELYELYVREGKTVSVVSRELGISADVVKNRLREFGWSRSTKESCSSNAFRERIRQLRVGVLTSSKVVESPNKLERLVYDAIDQHGVFYQKQVPLFGKFVVDVLFPQQKLVLEIFGRYWRENPKIIKKDFSKKKYLEKCGYKVEEFWDYEIKQRGVDVLLQDLFKKYCIT